jgi:hypothetical protein
VNAFQSCAAQQAFGLARAAADVEERNRRHRGLHGEARTTNGVGSNESPATEEQGSAPAAGTNTTAWGPGAGPSASNVSHRGGDGGASLLVSIAIGSRRAWCLAEPRGRGAGRFRSPRRRRVRLPPPSRPRRPRKGRRRAEAKTVTLEERTAPEPSDEPVTADGALAVGGAAVAGAAAAAQRRDDEARSISEAKEREAFARLADVERGDETEAPAAERPVPATEAHVRLKRNESRRRPSARQRPSAALASASSASARRRVRIGRCTRSNGPPRTSRTSRPAPRPRRRARRSQSVL